MRIVGERWESYVKPHGLGRWAAVDFCVDAADEEEHVGYEHGRDVVLYFGTHEEGSFGLPIARASERLRRLEHSLIDELHERGVDGRHVGRLTAGGARELLFQVEDVAGFEATLASWHAAFGAPKMRLIERAGWVRFDEEVKPRPEHWRQIEDQRTIDGLMRLGSDPEQIHRIEFRLAGQPEWLRDVAEELRGFAVELGVARLFVIERARLQLQSIWRTSRLLQASAVRHGVTYEGWGLASRPGREPPVREELLILREDGSSRIVLCPRCFGQIDPSAEVCRCCLTRLQAIATIELTLHHHAEMQRIRCHRCDEPHMARASVCPHCGAETSPVRMAG